LSEVGFVGALGWIAFAAAVLVMLLGVAGTVVPILPGLPLVWLAMAGFAAVEGFVRVDGTFLLTTLAVVVAAEVADQFGRAYGARRFGAGRAGSIGAVIGSIAGLFFLPVGLVLGPFLGATVGELLAGKDGPDAVRAGFGGLIGALGSMVVKLFVGIGLVIAFVVQVV
jgi:uncharacterized protein YqgC (DUF456 family)